MENRFKLWISTIAILAIVCVGCGDDHSHENGAATGSPVVEDDSDYFIKYDWSEKPRIGTYTLRVNLVDKSGESVEDAEVAVSYDMPSMRGAHATTETMKQNAKGDYLLPILFVMPGDWEIVVSARKDGIEIATETIRLDL